VDLPGLERFWEQTPGFALVLTRIGTLFVSAPLFGGPFAPMRVKVLLSFALALLIAPVAQLPAQLPRDGAYLLLLVQEAAVGLSLGFVMTLFFEGVRAGGELINRHAGFSAAENFDPDSGLGEGPIGDMMHIALILLFLGADMHHQVLATLARSYEAVPVGAWSLQPAFLHMASAGTNQCMVIALAISFPVLAAVLLITITEGVLTRAVPQINVMFISFSVKILVSMLVLWAAMPAAVAFMGGILVAMQQAMLAALPLMR
jgi:flagellar biosynthetic protein FliR